MSKKVTLFILNGGGSATRQVTISTAWFKLAAALTIAAAVAAGLAPGAMTLARGVLQDYGNMSAASLLFVLERTLGLGIEGRQLLTALGPGFTAGFLLLEAAP